MTPDEARQMYRDQITAHGEVIYIRRYVGTGTGRPYTDKSCHARVMGYQPDELVGTVTQGDRKIIALAEDLEGYSPVFTPTKSDKAMVRGAELSIISIDDSTKRIGSTLIAYVLQARG
jgi:hypothetical protein